MTTDRRPGRRVYFVNRFFYPDLSATAQLLTDLCAELADDYDIHVVASQASRVAGGPCSPGPESVRGCTVHRLAAQTRRRDGLTDRALSYAMFCLRARKFLRHALQPGDIVVVKTDPPALAAFLAPVIRRRGALLVNWLQDLYPEVAAVLGVRLGPLAAWLRYRRNRALQAAVANVALGERMARRIADCGGDGRRIRIIQNWCDDHRIAPLAAADNPLRQQWGLDETFIVGYSGNLGRAHEFETILAAAERLRDKPQIRFLFIGGGHQFAALRERVQAAHLQDRFVFRPYQPREQLPHSLPLADACIVSLHPGLEGLIVPSKFYGILAAGRPVLNIASVEGELAAIIAEAECGFTIAPGDDAGLAGIIARLAGDPGRVAELGRNARALLDARYRRELAFDRWRRLLAGMPDR